MNKPRVYLAAPFFNSAQSKIVDQLEAVLTTYDFPHYSPRRDSGSHLLSPEERRTHAAWKPVLQSNLDEIYKCDLMLAVVEYAMPHGYVLGAFRPRLDVGTEIKRLELPDNGVVFEIGGAYFLRKSVVTYHSGKGLSEMNLMLSHTARGHITGIGNLIEFLVSFGYHEDPGNYGEGDIDFDWELLQTFSGEVI